MTRLLRLLPPCTFLAVLLCCGAASLRAQNITLLNLNSENFPDLSSEFIIVDALGRQITDISSENFELTENGVPIGDFTIDCPPSVPPQRITALLTCDRSISMGERLGKGTATRLDLLKSGVTAFIRSVDFTTPTTVGITSFNNRGEIVHDFTNDTSALIASLDRLKSEGSTLYNPALLDFSTGAIPLLKTQPSFPPRYLIFITDGLPFDSLLVDQIVEECLRENIRIFTITLALPMIPELDRMAKMTGGDSFGPVYDEATLQGIYTLIAMRAQELNRCTIRWRSFNDCAASQGPREVKLTYKPLNVSATLPYTPPPSFAITMKVDPEFLYFGEATPPEMVTRKVTLAPRNGTYMVTSATIPPGTPFTVLDWGGTLPPFILREGESRTLTIGFTPTTVTLYSSSLQFESSPCAIPPVPLLGGIPAPDAVPNLELVAPNGGETFGGCDSLQIRWRGTTPFDTVRIEYSDDDGATWKMITDHAVGLVHNWLPPAPGSTYRIRIATTAEQHADTVTTIAGGGDDSGDRATERQLHGPSSFAVSGDLVFLAEAGGHVVSMMDLITGRYSIVAGTGTPGYTGDGGAAKAAKLHNPTGMAFHDRYLYIADQSNHRIRRVDISSGIITTVAGTGEPGFGGDGGPATSAKLLNPSHVVATETMLYISDKGNNRIRSVNLPTGVIRTIAGGGTSSGGANTPGTSLELKGPTGMAIVHDTLSRTDTLYFAEEMGHIVRRLDLRSGLVSLAAGTGTAGYLGDGGRGVDAWLAFPQDLVAAGSNIYIADSRNYRVREFNRFTRRITTVAGNGRNGFYGDGGLALEAAFSRVMAVGWHGPHQILVADYENERVRMVTLGDVGRSDSSDNPFTVATPRLATGVAGRIVEFGNLALDAIRDTIVHDAVCNRGSMGAEVDSIALIGANPGDFEIVAGVAAGEIAPGECQVIEIRFRPRASGPRSARAVIYGTCGTLDTLTLSGIGLQSCGIATLDRQDFGEVQVGMASADVILQRVICNNGVIPVQGTIGIEPTDAPFALVSGGGAFTLSPGECREISVRFTPRNAGRVSATIDFGIPSYCATASTQLLGRGMATEGIDVVTSVQIPALRCDTRSHDTAITIGNRGSSPLVITDIALTVNDGGFSLTGDVPAPTAPLVVLPGATGSVGIRFTPATHGPKNATIRITPEGPREPVDVAITGRWDSLRLAAGEEIVVFDGELPAGSYPLETFVTIHNTGTVAMTLTAGTISGADAGRFDLPDGQFPRTVPPGDSVRVMARALAPAEGAGYHGVLSLAAEPSCDSDLVIELFEAGSGPAISVLAPQFPPLLCPDETMRDTMLTIRNPGGSELRITAAEVRGTGAAAFVFEQDLPIIVPARGSVTLPIRFAPPSPGTFTAQLMLTGNAPGGETTIELTGRLAPLSWSASAQSLDFGHVLPGTEGRMTLDLRNDGSEEVRIELPAGAGAFEVLTPSPLVIPPGGERSVEVMLRNAAEGDFSDTLMLLEPRCGTALSIPLSAGVFTPAYTVVTLPEDSAGPGATVSLPIRIDIPDRTLFDLKGARAYRAVVTFSGAILVPDGATGAQIVAQSYDPATSLRRLTLEGEYSGTSDTLAVLLCHVPRSDVTATPLTFEEFTWDNPQVFPTKINGSFTLLDTCYTGRTLVSRPQALKIRPMPAGDEAVVEVDLEETHTLRMTLVDETGRETLLMSGRQFGAGHHELPLDLGTIPPGRYTLVLSTNFDRTSMRIVVVK